MIRLLGRDIATAKEVKTDGWVPSSEFGVKIPPSPHCMSNTRLAVALLGAIQTGRVQGRSAMEFFRQALEATVSPTGSPPSLIPTALIIMLIN